MEMKRQRDIEKNRQRETERQREREGQREREYLLSCGRWNISAKGKSSSARDLSRDTRDE